MLKPGSKAGKAETSELGNDHQMIRGLTLSLVLLVPMLLAVLMIGSVNPVIQVLIYLLIALDLGLLVLIRTRFYQLSFPIMIVGMSALASMIVFNRSSVHSLEIYMLTAFHLFLLVIASLITYRPGYAIGTTLLGLVSIGLHWGTRIRPVMTPETAAHIDDVVICTFILISGCVLIVTIIGQKKKLLGKALREADENRTRALQLEAANTSLEAAVADAEQAESKYRLLVENAADAIVILKEGHIRFANRKTSEILGYSLEELSAMPFDALLYRPGGPNPAAGPAFIQERSGGPLQTYQMAARSGAILWVQLSTVETTWEGEPASLHFMRDMTEQKRLENHLQQAQKMEAIGTLAGGIAHDFNNMLSGIFGFAQLAKKHLDSPERAAGDIDQIVKGAQKAADLVQQILSVSRQSAAVRQPLKLQVIVKETLKLMRATIPTTIEIRQEIDSSALVMADPTNLHQVIMNLCTNAFHAMEADGGILTVSLKDLVIRYGDGRPCSTMRPGRYIEMAVRDTGHGMETSLLNRIFDPYFTTKKADKGTGLGLAVVRGILDEHEGYIAVDSRVGDGSVFRCFLPALEDCEKGMDCGAASKIPAGGTECILMVDDEESIIDATGGLLREYGYTICGFTQSRKALEAFLAEPERFDLVITDFTMPCMTGLELARRILSAAPGKPVILCTGYSEAIDREKAMAAGILAYVEKPLVTREILTIIRQALESRSN